MATSKPYSIPLLPLAFELEDKAIFRQLNRASRLLGEMKGAAEKIPNKDILISALSLMEAKESSAVENIVTTHDELYKADLRLNIKEYSMSSSTKEVMNYREAIRVGYTLVKEQGLLTNRVIKDIQQVLEGNSAGFRTVPGTKLKDSRDNEVYMPPQDGREIEKLMQNLEAFINDDDRSDLDDLIKMAVIHHQFESIHPFYDGNGRTGRIICVLYLVAKGLLDLPILYLSHYITQHKGEYYRLLQAVRDEEDNAKSWRDWVLFMLKGVEVTAASTLSMIKGISTLMADYKRTLKPIFGQAYKHELLNNLFFHPYTKIEYMMRDMMVGRKTAAKYLNMIVEANLLTVVKEGTTNYYINTGLVDLVLNHHSIMGAKVDSVESIHHPT